MNIFIGFTYLVIFYFLGEFISLSLGLTIPGNVIGMLLFLFALILGIIKFKEVEESSDILLSNLAFFFVPSAVGIIRYITLLRRELLPLIGGTIVSTIIVLIVTSKVSEGLTKLKKGAKDNGTNN